MCLWWVHWYTLQSTAVLSFYTGGTCDRSVHRSMLHSTAVTFRHSRHMWLISPLIYATEYGCYLSTLETHVTYQSNDLCYTARLLPFYTGDICDWSVHWSMLHSTGVTFLHWRHMWLISTLIYAAEHGSVISPHWRHIWLWSTHWSILKSIAVWPLCSRYYLAYHTPILG
jgi:hypothetical protein